jgi:hypothetical protein
MGLAQKSCFVLEWRFLMRKKTIALLFVPGIILAIVGTALYLSGIFAADAVINSTTSAQTAHDVAVAALYAPLPLVLLGVGGILYLVSWIGALVATGKQGRWGWFVTVFLLSGPGQLIYLIAGPGLKPAATAPATVAQ